MTASKSFPVFDADSHVVEPPDLWERYVDRDYRALAKQALWREEGETGSYLKVNGKVFRDVGSPNIPRHAIWQPGMTWESVGDLDPDVRHPLTPGASGPQARLLHMDLMGVDQAFLYPTWFAEGFPLIEDPDVAHVLARAYNDWIADFCAVGTATSLRSSHASAAEYGLCVTGVAPRRREAVLPRCLHPASVR